jgi:hypothetical protein
LRKKKKCTNRHQQQQKSSELKVQKHLKEERHTLITITNSYEKLEKKK